jgi:hypothetical protein
LTCTRIVKRDLFFFFFFFTLGTDPRRSLSLKLSAARVYEPQIRARLGITAHFCKVVIKTGDLVEFDAVDRMETAAGIFSKTPHETSLPNPRAGDMLTGALILVLH